VSDRQADRELVVFGRFLSARGLPIGPRHFEKRHKPEPDILHTPPDAESVAFELVELIDQGWARHLNTIPVMQNLLLTTYNALPRSIRTPFAELYTDADIGFTFNERSSRHERLNALPKVFAAMLELPVGAIGPALEDDSRFAHALEHVYIGRAPALLGKGPIFHTSGGLSVGDPTVEQVAAKFDLAPTYQSHAPIELLAYIDRNAQFPDDVWQASLTQFLKSAKEIPFRRIWILDCRTNTVFTSTRDGIKAE
jgi:hypothetical protein